MQTTAQPTPTTPVAGPSSTVQSDQKLKLLVVGALLLVATVATVSWWKAKKQPTVPPVAAPVEMSKTVNQDTSLSFSPDKIQGKPGEMVTVEVRVNSGENNLGAAELGIKYDPALLTAGDVTIGSYFQPTATMIRKIIDQQKGEIKFTLLAQPKGTQKGEGILATVSFVIGNGSVSTGTLEFLPGTQIAAIGEPSNVIKSFGKAQVQVIK